MNRAIDDVAELHKASHKTKQQLIAFAAIPLATYAEGKQNGSDETVKVAQQLAGNMIELVLKV